MSICQFCQKSFVDKYKLERHQKTTRSCLKIQEASPERAKKECNTEQLLQIIANLQVKLEEAKQKNNVQIISYDDIKRTAETLTFEKIDSGVFVFAEFVYENMLKGKIKCVDYSRKKFIYKETEDNIIEDYNLTKLIPLLFAIITPKIFSVIDNAKFQKSEKIKVAKTEDIDENDFDEYTELCDLRHDLENAIAGKRTKWLISFIGILAALSK